MILEDSRRGGDEEEERVNEMVWWPPQPVMELARLAVDSGGDPAAIHRALDPTVLPVSVHFLPFFVYLWLSNPCT